MISVEDLQFREALHAATRMRMQGMRAMASPAQLREAVAIVGGRLSHLNKASRAADVVNMAHHMKQVEKAWLLSQIGLIPDCDDDVMDEVSSFVLTFLLTNKECHSKNGVRARGY